MTTTKPRFVDADNRPVNERQFRRLVSRRWWDPEVRSQMTDTERRFFRDLPWWQEDIRRCLPAEAVAAYEQAALGAAVAAYPLPKRFHDIASIEDPLVRLEAADAAYKALRHASWQIAEVRREALLDAEAQGAPTRVLADVIKTTTANVRQLVLKIKREKNLPIPAAYGGPHRKNGR